MIQISAKLEYACLAVLELAAHWGSSDPVRIRDIAAAHGIPSRFLVQILLQLKGAGLVQSERGAAGGYLLARAPQDISLAEVAAIMEGPAGPIRSSAEIATPAVAALSSAWNEILDLQHKMLSETNFAQLVERLQRAPQEMYYI